MWHPGEDELVEHLIGDGDAAERRRIDAHLLTCADCRRVGDEITGALTLVDTSVPEPPAGFERVMWARVQEGIARDAQASRWSWRHWVPAGSLAAIALIGVSLATETAPPAEPAAGQTVATAVTTADAGTETLSRVLYTALDSHFQQTEMLLIELRNSSDRDSLDYEQLTADELVSAGRLYRQTAEYAGRHRLVQMLDELEPLLVEVARGPERMAAPQRNWLRSKIDDDALLFRVRAAASDVRERVANPD
jgi:hypothetical protein